MAVTYNAGGSITSSSASTTVIFVVPSVVTAGDVWICAAVFRAGSTVTISGVSSGLTLIDRFDTGTGTSDATLIAYWYVALGTESGTFATITLSASSKSMTVTDAFSGANTSAPIVSGSKLEGVAYDNIQPPVDSAGQASYAFIGLQQPGAVPTVVLGSGSPSPTDTASGRTTGGSGATNVGLGAAYSTTQVTTAPTWGSGGVTSTTGAYMRFTIDQATAAAFIPRPTIITQAVQRAAIW